jgi:hypothetical protein
MIASRSLPIKSLPIKRGIAQARLGEAARSCGGLLNSVMVVVGDHCGLYKTGQYSSDSEQLLAPSPAVAHS